jgi:predicted ATPase
LLAHHCEEAWLTEKAIDYWLAAGRQAWGRSMLAEAVALLRRGLALVPGLPDSGWRREREFDLQIALGQALSAFQSWSAPEAGEAYARAQQLAAAAKRPRDLLLALWGQHLYYCVQADLNRARQVASVLLEFGETSRDVASLQSGSHMRGVTNLFCGEFAEARADLEQSLAHFDSGRRPLSIRWSRYWQIHPTCWSAWDTSIKHCPGFIARCRRRGSCPVPTPKPWQ